MNKKIIPIVALTVFTGLAASCGGNSTSAKEKPLIFYNRQPSKADNTVDTNVMKWSDKTYYGGFNAVAGGDTQGQMIVDYIKEHAAEMDVNKDGTIGYVLAIGQNSHNDSEARTRGVRRAFGLADTAQETAVSGEGSVTAKDGKTYKIKELAAKEMRDAAGPWSSSVAADTMGGWMNQYNDQIDLVVSNNDGMAEGMIGQYGKRVIPTFGYDANTSTLNLIKQGGSMKGTISQNHHAQVLTVLQLARNVIDGLKGDEVTTAGFTKADKYGNQIKSAVVNYKTDAKAMLAENGIVTATNVDAILEDTLDAGIKQTNAEKKKLLWTVYSATDNFLNHSFIPTVKRYAKFYNFDISYIYGDGTQESSLTSQFTNLGNYDGYVVNMVETTSGALYQEKLNEA